MIVCHCHGITDREIRASVQRGASDCWDVADACGAGSGCGGCHELVSEIVQSERRRLCVLRAEPSGIGQGLGCRASALGEEAQRQSA